MLELRGIEKSYPMGQHRVQALQSVTLSIEEGDFIAIMGPSGSGKSTLLHILGLLDVPERGSYKIDGLEASSLSGDSLSILRRDVVGFVFQQFNLLPRMSALENVSLPLLYSERKMDFDRSGEALARVGLSDRMGHRPNQLSGGQQQRVAIARSLINRPKMILADEPTGNLDSTSQKEILDTLRSLNDSGITLVIVTHEEEIGRQAKRLIRMRDGSIQSDERLVPLQAKKGSSGGRERGKKEESGSGFALQRLRTHFEQGLKTLAASKVRTALSMLGVLIGVGAVVTMMALGRGAQKAIEEQLSSLGSNLLVLRTGAMNMGGARVDMSTVTRLTPEDAKSIQEEIPGIKGISSNISGRVQTAFLAKNWNTNVTGTDASYAESHASQPDVGRFFTSEENTKRSRVAVVGRRIVTELFEDKNPIGEQIKINKISFTVIGVLPEKGASTFQDQDDRILIPVLTAMYRLFGRASVDYIELEVSDPARMESVQEETIEFMIARHRIPPSRREDAFQIRNMAEIQAALSASTGIMTLLLSVIAAISLVVGGIGIMNIMLVSVTERTREIGLRKAVGARRSDILYQFLVESVVVSLLGGLSGIGLALITTFFLSYFTGWATSITLSSVGLSVMFSAGVGIVFGLYPAIRASKLAPIDALRSD